MRWTQCSSLLPIFSSCEIPTFAASSHDLYVLMTQTSMPIHFAEGTAAESHLAILRDCRGGQQIPQQPDEEFVRLATTFLSRCLASQMSQIRFAPEKRKHLDLSSLHWRASQLSRMRRVLCKMGDMLPCVLQWPTSLTSSETTSCYLKGPGAAYML